MSKQVIVAKVTAEANVHAHEKTRQAMLVLTTGTPVIRPIIWLFLPDTRLCYFLCASHVQSRTSPSCPSSDLIFNGVRESEIFFLRDFLLAPLRRA
jgi:hypothetical protein